MCIVAPRNGRVTQTSIFHLNIKHTHHSTEDLPAGVFAAAKHFAALDGGQKLLQTPP